MKRLFLWFSGWEDFVKNGFTCMNGAFRTWQAAAPHRGARHVALFLQLLSNCLALGITFAVWLIMVGTLLYLTLIVPVKLLVSFQQPKTTPPWEFYQALTNTP